MWYLCCVCLPPVFLFSPPVHSVPYQTAAASRSAYRHAKSIQNIGGGGSTAANLCAHLYVSDLPVLTCCLGLTLILVLYRLQAQLSVDTWQWQKRNMQEDCKWVRTLYEHLCVQVSVCSNYLPPWCGPACSPAAPPEAPDILLPDLPPPQQACCSPGWAAHGKACTQTQLRLRPWQESSDALSVFKVHTTNFTKKALLVFEIQKLFFKVGHLIQTFHPPSLTVLLIHFCNIMHTLTFGLGITRCDRRQQKQMHRYTLADTDSVGLNW